MSETTAIRCSEAELSVGSQANLASCRVQVRAGRESPPQNGPYSGPNLYHQGALIPLDLHFRTSGAVRIRIGAPALMMGDKNKNAQVRQGFSLFGSGSDWPQNGPLCGPSPSIDTGSDIAWGRLRATLSLMTEYLTLAEVAARTGKSKVTVRRYLDAHRFPNAVREDGRRDGRWLVPWGDVVNSGLTRTRARLGESKPVNADLLETLASVDFAVAQLHELVSRLKHQAGGES